ncbi:6-pyruvoyl trahydropterin synthase family protein [Streptomyces sp. LE64]|uniref:6-pyruvoyl trahydropterin synthase family protein n=1 Tax=Streptomyces sp. LE64 TaxID=3448653 RepID=UPI004042C276
MLSITKEFHFSASHRLDHLTADHPCSRMHGHNYVLMVELSLPSSQLSRSGFVRDYGDLDVLKKWIDELLDHRHLNDVMTDRNPSAENIAMWVYENWREEIPEMTAVRVSETPKTWATYRPSG